MADIRQKSTLLVQQIETKSKNVFVVVIVVVDESIEEIGRISKDIGRLSSSHILWRDQCEFYRVLWLDG